MTREEKVTIILQQLRKLFPNLKIALNYSQDHELLIAVILAAQCTDKKVNEVTEKLFKKYPTIEAFANADFDELCVDLHSTGFYRAKAKNVIATAQKLRDTFGSKLPRTMAEMITLPGVARKTANVVLSELYGIHEGIAVDTHVTRLANKFGLTQNTDPVKIEKDLIAITPPEDWRLISLGLVQYGRDYSPAHKKDKTDDPISQALHL